MDNILIDDLQGNNFHDILGFIILCKWVSSIENDLGLDILIFKAGFELNNVFDRVKEQFWFIIGLG